MGLNEPHGLYPSYKSVEQIEGMTGRFLKVEQFGNFTQRDKGHTPMHKISMDCDVVDYMFPIEKLENFLMRP